MPTSLISSVTLENIGPLTTTFTAPDGCGANGDYPPLIAGTANPQIPLYGAYCKAEPTAAKVGDCLPGGEKWDEYFSQNMDGQKTAILYYSPGNVCPHAWTTGGIARKDGDGSISATGAFSATEFTEFAGGVSSEPPFQPIMNYLAQALNGGETAIICCPSGLEADPLYGGCQGTTPIESYTATTACRLGYRWTDVSFVDVTYTYNDLVLTGTQPVFAGGTPTLEVVESIELVVSTTTGGIGEATEYATSDFVGFTDAPMVFMVNKGEGSSDGDGDKGGDGGSNGGNGGTSNDNGNAAFGGKSAVREGISTLLVVWGFAAFVCVGLVTSI